MAKTRPPQILKSKEFSSTLKDIKKEVKESKGSEKWKKTMVKIIDGLSKTEKKFAEIDSLIENRNAANQLQSELTDLLNESKLSKDDLDKLTQFKVTYKGNYKVQAFDKYAEYTSMVQYFVSAKEKLEALKKNVDELRKSFTLSSKIKDAILVLNAEYQTIIKEFEENAATSLSQLSVNDAIIFAKLKACYSTRVDLINLAASTRFLSGKMTHLEVLDDLIDAHLDIINLNVPEYKKITDARNAFLAQTKIPQGAAGTPHSISSPKPQPSKDEKPEVKKQPLITVKQ